MKKQAQKERKMKQCPNHEVCQNLEIGQRKIRKIYILGRSC